MKHLLFFTRLGLYLLAVCLPFLHPAVAVPYDRIGIIFWFALVPLEMLAAFYLAPPRLSVRTWLLVAAVPVAATAPALIIVGALMVTALARVDWSDLTEGIPAFVTFAAIPLTYSISHGIAAGFIAYPLMKLAAGRARQVSPVVWILFALCLMHYVLEATTAAG